MKIDIFSHILPQKFLDAFSKRVGDPASLRARPYQRKVDTAERYDLGKRMEIMDRFSGLVQVLTPTAQSLERHAKPDDTAYLVKIYNDAMAELVLKYPDKFVAAVARLPQNNIDASLEEIERAINELKFKGILVHTPMNGQPLDSPDYWPIYESMLRHDLPIWIHPTKHYTQPDYTNEEMSKYGLFHVYGWPYETTLAMARLVCSGVMGKYPNIKFITHHAGAMIPFLSGRIHMLECPYEYMDKNAESSKSPDEYFKMFYNDTALYGNAPGLMCAQSFFGTDHIVFGTDLPYGPGFGEQYTRLAIEAVEGMNISSSDKKKVYEDNAKALLHLDIKK